MKENLLCQAWQNYFQPQICTSAEKKRMKNRAFSLVEMLMALLVASLLMAALAPVMTKKMNENMDVNVFGNSKPISACAFMTDNADADIDNAECAIPSDAHTASAIIVSGGGGGGGARESVSDDTVQTSGVMTGKGESNENATSSYQYVVSKNFTITKDMSDIEIEMISAGEGGGIGNYNLVRPTSQTSCGNWGVFVSAAQNGGNPVCVSRYNASNSGDGGATPKSNIAGVNNAPVGTNCSAGNCCWYGQTAKPCEASSAAECSGYTNCTVKTSGVNGQKYNGCNRMVCGWDAANIICNNWKPTKNAAGRLPKRTELQAWTSYVGSGGALQKYVNDSNPGLQLCDQYSDKNTLFCGTYAGCPGSVNDYCSAYHIWSGQSTGETNHYHYGYLRGGVLYDSGGGEGIYSGSTHPMSVRCVHEGDYNLYTGAGGASGQYVKLKIPNEVLKKAFELTYDSTTDAYVNDPVDILILNFLIGKGGKVGSNSNNPYAGGVAATRIIKKSQVVFQINSYAGGRHADSNADNTNGNATTSRDGIPSSITGGLSAHTVTYLNTYSDNPEFRKYVWGKSPQYFASEGVFLDQKTGKLGNSLTNSDGSSNGTSLGAGGASYWGGVWGLRGDTSENSQPGSGGRGGYCTLNESGIVECTPPTAGTAGAAILRYKRSYPGIGGNGGNAGSVLHVKNIQVTPNSTIKVKAGAGGSGGVAGSDGRDGGNSWVEFPNGQKFEVLGGKGGKTGIAAIPSSNTYAKPAEATAVGENDILTSSTKTYLNSLSSKNYEIFPSNATERKYLQGKQAAVNNNDITVYKASGGNGGMNSKTGPLAGARGIPCGAFSTTSIKIGNKEYKCGTKEFPTTTYNPSRISRVLSEEELKNKASNYSKYYAPGATGGAGAGWSNDYKTGNTPKTGQGGDGMGGYVLIYFNK